MLEEEEDSVVQDQVTENGVDKKEDQGEGKVRRDWGIFWHWGNAAINPVDSEQNK